MLRIGRAAAVLTFAFGLAMVVAGIAAMTASATKPSPTHKLVICHATGSGSNPYAQLVVDIAPSGYVDGDHSRHDRDIIPPYSYGDFSYQGKNWDAEGQATWANGCSPGGSIAGAAAGSAPSPAESGVLLAETGGTPPGDGLGAVLSCLGFLAMAAGVVGYSHRGRRSRG